MDVIKNKILEWVELGKTELDKLLADPNGWWIVTVAAFVLVVLALIGLIFLFTKSWKALLVIAILGGVAYAVWYFVLRQDPTTSTTAASIGFNIIKFIL